MTAGGCCFCPWRTSPPIRASPALSSPSPSWRSWPGPSAHWGCSSPSPSAGGRGAGSWWRGERRLRAAKLAGLQQVPCLSVQADGQTSSLFALVENLQRRDLDFWEEALALRRLQEDFALSQEELARRLGKSQSAIANKLRLLKLPQEVLSALRDAGCTERHARSLLRLPDGEQQRRAADRAIRDKLTVAQTEALVESMLRSPPPKKRRPTLIVKDVRLFLNTISHSLDVMRSAGVDAQCQRQDAPDAITLTIRIPTPPRT